MASNIFPPKKPAKVYSSKHRNRKHRKTDSESNSTYLSLSTKYRGRYGNGDSSSSSSEPETFPMMGQSSVFKKTSELDSQEINDGWSDYDKPDSLSVGDSKESYYVLKNKEGGAFTVERISPSHSQSSDSSIELMREAALSHGFEVSPLKILKENIEVLQDSLDEDKESCKPLNSTLLNYMCGKNINDLTEKPNLSIIKENDAYSDIMIKANIPTEKLSEPYSSLGLHHKELVELKKLEDVPELSILQPQEDVKQDAEQRHTHDKKPGKCFNSTLMQHPAAVNIMQAINPPELSSIHPMPAGEKQLVKTPISTKKQVFKCTTPKKKSKFSNSRAGKLAPKTSTFIYESLEPNLDDIIQGISVIKPDHGCVLEEVSTNSKEVDKSCVNCDANEQNRGEKGRAINVALTPKTTQTYPENENKKHKEEDEAARGLAKRKSRRLTSTPVKDDYSLGSLCSDISTVVLAENTSELCIGLSSREVNTSEIVPDSLNLSDPFDDSFQSEEKQMEEHRSFPQMSVVSKSKTATNKDAKKLSGQVCNLSKQNIPQCCIETFPEEPVHLHRKTSTSTNQNKSALSRNRSYPDDILSMEL